MRKGLVGDNFAVRVQLNQVEPEGIARIESSDVHVKRHVKGVARCGCRRTGVSSADERHIIIIKFVGWIPGEGKFLIIGWVNAVRGQSRISTIVESHVTGDVNRRSVKHEG